MLLLQPPWRPARLLYFAGLLLVVILVLKLARRDALRGLRVAVIEQTDAHEALSITVSQLRALGVDTTVYWDHSRRGTPPVRPVALSPDALAGGDSAAAVLTTCDGPWKHEELHLALHSVPVVVCIVHDSLNTSLTSTMRYVALSEGVAASLRGALSETADGQLETLAPVYPLYHPNRLFAPHRPKAGRAANGRLHRAGIVGASSQDAGAMGIALERALYDDPATWGYQRVAGGSLRPIEDADPFELHVIGRPGEIEELDELQNVGVVHRTIARGAEYYQQINQMDVILPVLADRPSSSIPAALIAQTPVLVSPAAMENYTYLAPPGVVITGGDDAESMVAALAAMRRGDLELGARGGRNNRTWEKYMVSLTQDNARTWRRLLL